MAVGHSGARSGWLGQPRQDPRPLLVERALCALRPERLPSGAQAQHSFQLQWLSSPQADMLISVSFPLEKWPLGLFGKENATNTLICFGNF